MVDKTIEEIKKEAQKIPETEGKKPVAKKGEMVEVEKIQLDNILNRIAELEGKKKQKRVTLLNKTCRVRFFKDQIVIGYGKTWEKRLQDGGKVLMLEVITEDEKVHAVEFVDFNETGVQKVAEIIETKQKEIEEEIGFVFAKKVDYDNYRTYETDKEVPLINKSIKHTYKLKLEGGKEIWLDESAVN